MKGQQESLTTIVVKERNWATQEALNSTGYQISNGQKALRLSSQVTSGLLAPDNRSSVGNPQELWRTPRAEKTSDENPETWALRQAKGDVATMPLTAQVKAWATPQSRDYRSGDPARREDPARSKNLNDQMGVMNGKLNPAWVCCLMGLPVNWTRPN
jgi:hypothetical protein